MAAVIAEQKFYLPAVLPEGLPLVPEILVPRLGEYLLEKGNITHAQLSRALQHQAEMANSGHPILLGQALRELGFVDTETLDQAITVQILQLHYVLEDINRQLERRVQERTHELEQALQNLAELNQLKANFIANISHELRTPLTHIKGYLDILAEGSLGSLTPQQNKVLGVIRKAEGRLEKLIEDLIQYSFAARGALNLKLTTTNLSEVVKSAINQVSHKAETAGISIGITLPQDLPPVRCDKDKIAWVLAQLLDNAVKFTSEGGLVELEALPDDRFISIAVTDTGIGIPPERMNELFEPFHQLDSSTTRRYGGTGLGLALSSRILEGHGTRLKVQSVVGEGSRFEFSLPIAAKSKERE